MVLLRKTDLDTAIQLGERIREQICRDVMEVPNDRTVHLTASVGVTLASRMNGDIAEVVERADRALYVAKATGRNRVNAEVETQTAISTAA
jgi:diguanylate cyclase (GGDEF)-like protein